MPQPTAAAPAASATRVLRPTLETAGQWRAAIARWPELAGLIRQTQAQGLFPGLRALRITLTGAPQWVAKGLDAIDFQKTSQTPVLPLPGASAASPAGQE